MCRLERKNMLKKIYMNTEKIFFMSKGYPHDLNQVSDHISN